MNLSHVATNFKWDQIEPWHVRAMMRAGHDTVEIARAFRVSEAVVWAKRLENDFGQCRPVGRYGA